MVSFGVASLFTNVPLDETIEIILWRIDTTSPICKIEDLLYFCTKNLDFRVQQSALCKN